MSGTIFNIQRFSIHDGPGIRTTVFLKGCPLRCQWCHNPESNEARPQLLLFPHLCVGCGACIPVCPTASIEMSSEGVAITNRNTCVECGACVSACKKTARELSGRMMTAQEVIYEAGKDWRFYKTSGGGITFSGGEPLMQARFVEELIEVAKSRKFHLAMETCGYASWETAQRIFSQVDLLLYDMKVMDLDDHRRLTGVPNAPILENLRRVLDEMNVDIWLRMPLIAGVNDGNAELERRIRWLRARKRQAERIYLLPYHDLGLSKLVSMNMPTGTMAGFRRPDDERLDTWQQTLQQEGFQVLIG